MSVSSAAPSYKVGGRPVRFLSHVPESIDFAAAAGRRDWEDYARWFVGQVVFYRFRRHKVTAEDWCPMAADFVRQFIPVRVWPVLRDRLCSAGVLEWNRKFRPPTASREGMAYGFRIGMEHRYSTIIGREPRNPELLKNLVAHRIRERAAVVHPTHVGLLGWVEKLVVLDGAPSGNPVLDRIAIGDTWFVVCDQGRVHTPATNLSRNLRRFVRLAGHELVSVDVSCSQPLLLAATLSSTYNARAQANPTTAPTPPRNTIPLGVHYSNSRTRVIGNNAGDGFLDDCLAGALYDRLATAWGLTRDKAKSALLTVVYGYPHAFHSKRAAAFAEIYPATWAGVVSLSRGRKNGEVARMMQRVESELMISRVAGRFLRDYPGCPVLTVHDALLVRPDAKEKATKAIKDGWLERFGIEPTVKEEDWTGVPE